MQCPKCDSDGLNTFAILKCLNNKEYMLEGISKLLTESVALSDYGSSHDLLNWSS